MLLNILAGFIYNIMTSVSCGVFALDPCQGQETEN